jgi:hypothetical protein
MIWSTPDRIVVRGFDLVGDLLGKVDLGDMAFRFEPPVFMHYGLSWWLQCRCLPYVCGQ